MEIRELSFPEYLFLDKDTMHTALSNQYMSCIVKGAGKALALYDENCQILSYILLYLGKNSCKIVYICTEPSCRNKGYATKLIQNVKETYHGEITFNITDSFPSYQILDNLVKKLGFKVATCSRVFTAYINDKYWEKMDKLKFSQMKDFLLRDGGKCISFCDMDENTKNQLMKSPSNEFHNQLNPSSFLLNLRNGLDEELSSAMVKNDVLCSYILITRLTKETVCFEQISETAAEIGLGSVTAPLCYTLEKIRKHPEIKKMNLCILDDNDKSINYFLSMFSKDELKITKNINYCYGH